LGPVETIELPYGHFDFMVGDGAVTLGRSIAARISKEWKRGAGG
jgi:hypothetical protein